MGNNVYIHMNTIKQTVIFDEGIEAVEKRKENGHNNDNDKIVDWEKFKQQIYTECVERFRIAVYNRCM